MKTYTFSDAPNGAGIKGQRPTWISTNVDQDVVSLIANSKPSIFNCPSMMLVKIDISDLPLDNSNHFYAEGDGIVAAAPNVSNGYAALAIDLSEGGAFDITVGYEYWDEEASEPVVIPVYEIKSGDGGLTKTQANFDGTKYDLASLITPANYSGTELSLPRWYRITDSQDSSKEYVFSCQAPGLKINSMTKDQYGFRVEFDVHSTYSAVWYGVKGATSIENRIYPERAVSGGSGSGGGGGVGGVSGTKMRSINGRLCVGYLYILDDGHLYSWAAALSGATTDKAGSKWAADGVTIRLAPAFSRFFSKNNNTVSWYNGLEIMTHGYVQGQGYEYETTIGQDFQASISPQAFYQGGIRFASGATDSEAIEYLGGLLFGADKREDLDLSNNSFDVTNNSEEEWGYVGAGTLQAGTYTVTASTTDPETQFTRGSLKVLTLTWNQGVPVFADVQEAQNIYSDTPGVVTFTSTGSEAVFILVDSNSMVGIHVELDAAQ